ncbi:MAG: TonB-dependent receptor [Dysgonamonadaceae bacterium]|jgi:iron complex outermembrane receptor protein|nr:TonB-dependent receptor [Dysgonamonadaceae bacterium]
MHIRYLPVMLIVVPVFCLQMQAQEADTLKTLTLDEFVVTGSYRKSIDGSTSQAVGLADKTFLTEHFTGNLVQTLGHMAGIRSMDIGAGFAKPMIRGLGFNRIVVAENGVKQEGQQWGADHGLEIDAFNVERVVVRKGPSSLLYGSDAMGGVIEILPLPAPLQNQWYGEVALLGKSVNETLGGSLMLGVKRNAWHVKTRFSEQHFGDYRIPADTVVYLTQQMPIDGRKLKNTAGFERDASLLAEYQQSGYHAGYAVSNAFQKVGFFPGAHGVPDVSRLQDDGDSRNIDMPFSKVNHLKATTSQQLTSDDRVIRWDLGFQQNHREEWSLFHTHYATQPLPAKDPDKELAFSLSTASSALRVEWSSGEFWKHTAGWDVQYQRNSIAGYSFLLPEYKRFTTGGLWLSVFRPNHQLTVSGGVRYDFGTMNISGYQDIYLEKYLRERNYPEPVVEANKWRSYPIDRRFGDVSGSLGVVLRMSDFYVMKANIGRSFRLPGANELASNGVHHGAFRHEQGDGSLRSEHGWQLDAGFIFEREGIRLTCSPFFSWFENYIYLRPTGEWSVLPHAGQVYRYSGAEAVFAGSEAELSLALLRCLTYRLSGEYVYTHNVDEHTPMAFSPPASMRNALVFNPLKGLQLVAEMQTVATQNRIARNEERTRGANLVHLSASVHLPYADVRLSAHNLLNTAYFNHLSFYRRVEIPEPGRDIQLSIKIPFELRN